jgi:uncharacterized membrane protein
VGEEVTEGTSALFTLTSEAKLDQVVEELKQYDFEITLPTCQRSRRTNYARHSPKSSRRATSPQSSYL